MRGLKIVFYWLSVIPPVIDMLKGAILGVQRGLADIKEKDRLFREMEQRKLFDKANE